MLHSGWVSPDKACPARVPGRCKKRRERHAHVGNDEGPRQSLPSRLKGKKDPIVNCAVGRASLQLYRRASDVGATFWQSMVVARMTSISTHLVELQLQPAEQRNFRSLLSLADQTVAHRQFHVSGGLLTLACLTANDAYACFQIKKCWPGAS